MSRLKVCKLVSPRATHRMHGILLSDKIIRWLEKKKKEKTIFKSKYLFMIFTKQSFEPRGIREESREVIAGLYNKLGANVKRFFLSWSQTRSTSLILDGDVNDVRAYVVHANAIEKKTPFRFDSCFSPTVSSRRRSFDRIPLYKRSRRMPRRLAGRNAPSCAIDETNVPASQ